MSTGSSPPAQPPMMSPDGKWVWDGQKWIPVAVHESVFPAYGDAAAAAASAPAAAAVAETMVEPPVNPFAGPPSASPFAGPPASSPFAGPPPGPVFSPAAISSAPAVVSPPIVQPGSYSAAGATPPWQAWAAGGGERSRTMYMVAAFVAVAIGVVATIYLVSSHLPFLNSGNTGTPTPSAVPSPSPQLAVRSDSAVASRYVTDSLGQAMSILKDPLLQEAEACNGNLGLNVSCQQALTSMNSALTNALPYLAGDVPPCIARQVAKVKADLAGLEAGLKIAIKAFSDNSRNELVQGLTKYNNNKRPLSADVAAVSKAQAACDTQPNGP